MRRPHPSLFALLFAALYACAVHAQDAQKPEAAQQSEPRPAEEAQKPPPGPGQEPDPEILEKLLDCLGVSLPQDWKKTWFVVEEIERNDSGSERRFKANFFVATSLKDRKGRPLTPCGVRPVLDGVGALNAYLPEGQRRWTGATFSFTSEGKFEATYDYTPRKPAPAKPAAKKKQASGN